VTTSSASHTKQTATDTSKRAPATPAQPAAWRLPRSDLQTRMTATKRQEIVAAFQKKPASRLYQVNPCVQR